MDTTIRKYGFWAIALIYLGAIALSANLPVFWDMYGQVKTATWYLDHGFADLLPNGNGFSDNGHLPLYPLYLAVLFKVFGLKLWVAHFSVLPFILGLLVQLQKFSERYIHDWKVVLVLALTFFHPAILSQTIFFSNEIALAFFGLWLLNALLGDRASHICMSSVLLCLCNTRGIGLVLVLLVYFLWKKRSNAWYLVCGVIAWVVWMLVHYKLAGWLLQNPENMEHRSTASFLAMGRNAGLALWKMLDLGSVFGWAALLVIAFKAKKLTEPMKLLMLVSLPVLLMCIPLTNPVSNRYFLLSYVLLLPAFVHALQVLPKKMFRLVVLCFAVVLFSNNGVTYPNKYGNAWDCSLKSLPYFELRQQLDDYLEAQHVSRKDVEAGFQLYFNDRYYLLNGNDREYTLLSDTEMPTAEYVADSDICNNYNAERELFLVQYYAPVRSFGKGAVYIRLFRKK